MLLNLRLTMESGQTPEFVWNKKGDVYFRPVGSKICELSHDKELHFTTGFDDYVMKFLRKEDDLNKIYKKINTDELMNNAINKYRGLRITKNDSWETIVSFICSSISNIKRIRKNVQSMMPNGRMLTPSEMLKTNLNHLKLGFRQKYLLDAAKMIKNGYNVDDVENMSHEEAINHLTELPGVGNKVANCILLFSYDFLESFPIDTWIRKIMIKKYFDGKDVSNKKIQEFALDNWGKYAGYANQYLFCYARKI